MYICLRVLIATVVLINSQLVTIEIVFNFGLFHLFYEKHPYQCVSSTTTTKCYWSSVQQPRYLSSAKKEFRAKELKVFFFLIYLESHKRRKGEPAGLHGFQKRSYRGKERPLELRKIKRECA